eukprot:SAG22_NODE_200_length_15420_cov_4.424581_6_plen_371_part_00
MLGAALALARLASLLLLLLLLLLAPPPAGSSENLLPTLRIHRLPHDGSERLAAHQRYAASNRRLQISKAMLPPIKLPPALSGTPEVDESRASEHDPSTERWQAGREAADDGGAPFYRTEMHGGIVAAGQYYAYVDIGTPPTRFTLQVDTGSTVIALPAKQCNDCEDFVFYPLDDQHMVRYDDPATCCTGRQCRSDKPQAKDGCAFHLSYGDKSGANGVLARDAVKLANNVSAEITFGAILDEYGPFENSKYIDGILGMAFPRLGCTPSCVDSFIGQLNEKVGLADSFGMCLGPNGGAMVLGGNDPALYYGALEYLPLRSDSYFTVRAASILLDTTAIASYVDVVIDSGTTLLLLPDSIWHFFWEHVISRW